jgi:hypothetical protein
MSRHSRYRHADPRRSRPPVQRDGPRPVGTAPSGAPGAPSSSAPPASPQQAAPEVIEQPATEAAPSIAQPDLAVEPFEMSAPIAMAAMHAPTAAAPNRQEDGPGPVGCTPAQLRRFIKSRAYLPVHEIRRRFGIETADDDVTGFDSEVGRIYVGLPDREGRILGDLIRAGEVGYELQMDPQAPIVVGVYPMRPVTRQ